MKDDEVLLLIRHDDKTITLLDILEAAGDAIELIPFDVQNALDSIGLSVVDVDELSTTIRLTVSNERSSH